MDRKLQQHVYDLNECDTMSVSEFPITTCKFESTLASHMSRFVNRERTSIIPSCNILALFESLAEIGGEGNNESECKVRGSRELRPPRVQRTAHHANHVSRDSQVWEMCWLECRGLGVPTDLGYHRATDARGAGSSVLKTLHPMDSITKLRSNSIL